MIGNAPNENMMIEQSVMVVEAFWDLEGTWIFLYHMIFWLNYLVLIGYVVFALHSEYYSYLVCAFAGIMILIEGIQASTGKDYFKSPTNWFDILGPLGLITHVCLRIGGITLDKQTYGKFMLIFGLA